MLRGKRWWRERFLLPQGPRELDLEIAEVDSAPGADGWYYLSFPLYNTGEGDALIEAAELTWMWQHNTPDVPPGEPPLEIEGPVKAFPSNQYVLAKAPVSLDVGVPKDLEVAEPKKHADHVRWLVENARNLLHRRPVRGSHAKAQVLGVLRVGSAVSGELASQREAAEAPAGWPVAFRGA